VPDHRSHKSHHRRKDRGAIADRRTGACLSGAWRDVRDPIAAEEREHIEELPKGSGLAERLWLSVEEASDSARRGTPSGAGIPKSPVRLIVELSKAFASSLGPPRRTDTLVGEYRM